MRFMPFDVTLEVTAGTNLLEAVRRSGLPLKASCGGEGHCGECIVQIIKGAAGEAFETRPSAALSNDLAGEGYVLACITTVTDDITIDLPHFEEIYIKSVAAFTLPDDEAIGLSGTAEVSPIGSRADLWIPSGGSSGTIHGIACDIGTTTIALSLVNLETGDVVKTVLGLNRQLKCGGDIISRINYASKPGGLEELRKLATVTINTLIRKAIGGKSLSNRQVTEVDGISAQDIVYVSVSGNTTMAHLLLGADPLPIRDGSFAPSFGGQALLRAGDLDIRVHPEAGVYLAPAVGSYVGGDITAGLLATPMLRATEKVSMFIDVGTNGEIVVGNKDWLMTCACSAGPAFEGGGVRCGMPATAGAIERVKIGDDGSIEYRVIDDIKPRGFCGSGLVDLLAELLVGGRIDRQGKVRREVAGDRFIESESGAGFLVERADRTHWGHDLIITERDISNLIRTKGAVYSACALLLKQVGLTFNEAEAFYIAGGFGHHLDVENAIRVGLLPDMERERFHYLGNTSLLGAYLVLISDENRKMVEEYAKKMTYIELDTEPAYMNEYTGALFLPHTDLSLFPSVKKLLESGRGL
jgi:uncharacterized 2Fe-2S/4Fe-4S cluster protein (DUF4445 family)